MINTKELILKVILAYLASYVAYKLLLEVWCVAYGIFY